MKKARQFSQLDMHDMNVTSRRNSSNEGNRIQLKKWLTLAFLFIGPACYAQSATINWTNVHQVIDGFGAADSNEAGTGQELTTAQFNFFFGTTGSNLGLSIMRVRIPNDSGKGPDVGNCSTVNVGCVGTLTTDYASAVAAGIKIIAPMSAGNAPSFTGGSPTCSVPSAHYQDFANWFLNFVKSWKQYEGVYPYAVSVENEPEWCSGTFNAQMYHDTVAGYIGPTFANNSIPTLIALPEPWSSNNLISYGGTCMTDSACSKYVGMVDFHEYGAATVTAPDTVNAATYPSAWPPVAHYWETEASCDGQGSFCGGSGFDPSMTNAMNWAAVIDQRFAVDNLNAWLWWWMLIPSSATLSGQGLMEYDTGTIALRAYVLGQYSRFIRPGYFRIDATHKPQTGVSVSAYQDTPSGTLAIVATNYTDAAISQTFNLTNAPTFTSMTPYITSATQNIQAQAAQAVSSNSLTYTLPADSVTTFVGASSSSTIPAPPSNLRLVVN